MHALRYARNDKVISLDNLRLFRIFARFFNERLKSA